MITHDTLERQLATAQQITHIGSWEWDMRTNAVVWSDELYRIYGLEPQSCTITFESFLARVHPEDRDTTVREVRAALDRGCGSFEYPERIIRPDGSIRELETKGEVALDEAGKVVGLIGTCRDVTELRKRDTMLQLYADIVSNIQIGLSVWSVENSDDPSTITLVSFNSPTERIARAPLSKLVGKSFSQILPEASPAAPHLRSLLLQVARDRKAHEGVVMGSRDPGLQNRTLSMKAFPLHGGCVGVALEDITETTRARRLREAEQGIFEIIAQGAPLHDVLVAVTRAIEEHSPPMIASVQLLDEDGAHLRHGAAPNLPEAYNRAVDGLAIGEGQGSCGTAMFRRRPVFVDDIETDPLWEKYRAIAREYGLRGCWSAPVLASDGRVLGSFALYYRESRRPTPEDEALITRAARITGIAIERHQLFEQLRALSAHVEAVREEERTGIAREIHDELGQSLTALKMDLARLGRRATEADRVASALVTEQIAAMSKDIDGIIGEIRRISAELRPGVLDNLGLLAAIEWQAREFERRTGTPCTVKSNVEEEQLDAHLSTTVFRIFQEALTNVARHAEASRVEVELVRRDSWIELVVRDNGRGISPETATSPRSLGLLGIRERARNLKGTVAVGREATGGTSLALRLPLEASEGAGP